MVEELVREFVPRELADGLDFNGLRRANGKFHFKRRSFRRREADVIWKVPTRENRNLHWYLLIEFQSKSDAWMAVRTQVYEGLLWQQVIDEQHLQADARLPPLLLLVIYNGKSRWKAATTTGELIALSPDSTPWCWQPQVRYCLLDIGSFPKDELARRSSLVALLFRLEQRHSPGELKKLVTEVGDWFRRHEGYERLQALFTELVRGSCAINGVSLMGLSNSLEVNKMSLAETIGEWKQEWLAEGAVAGRAVGRAEGRAEGKAEGRLEGTAEALILLLVARFGAVAPSWRKRIGEAELATLEQWFKRAIDAPDLDSVFSSPS